MDPNPGGPKTSRSGSGTGSPTLLKPLLFRDQLKAKEEERVEIEEKYSSLQVSSHPKVCESPVGGEDWVATKLPCEVVKLMGTIASSQ
jgi:hypothetical protein